MSHPSRKITRSSKSLHSSIETLEARIAPAAFVVTTLSDSGAGSLRDAIAKANVHVGADTITFAATAHGEIKLTTGGIEISDSLTITGGNLVTINGNANSFIFNINDGNEAKDSPVTLSGLALVNARLLDNSGGAVNSAEGLTLSSVIVANNHADNNGGGVLVNTALGSVVVKNSRFINNEAVNSSGNAFDDQGGGLFVHGTKAITITNSQFVDNDSQGGGGGAYLLAGAATTKISVTGSVFLNNSAGKVTAGPDLTGVGGGLTIIGKIAGTVATTATITSSQFISNSADGSSGGVELQDGNFSVSKSVFSRNSVTNVGGGLQASGALGKVSVTSSFFDSNTSSHQGGGIFLVTTNGSTAFSLNGVTVSHNMADGEGGGIFVRGLNVAATSTSLAKSSSFALVNSFVIANSSASNGGGFRSDTGGTVSITGTHLDFNSAAGADGGGGLAVTTGIKSLTLTKDFVLSNSATAAQGSGGGLLANPADALLITVSGSTFSKNQAAGKGGGMFIDGGSGAVTTKLSTTTVSMNIAGGVGGGLNIDTKDAVSLTTVQILNNFSSTDTGGALLRSNGGITISGGAVSGNSALTGMGGLTLSSPSAGTAAITKTSFVQNDGGTGGGVLVSGVLSAQFTSVLITQNVGALEAGGILRQSNGSVTLTSSKVFGNIDIANPAKSDTDIV